MNNEILYKNLMEVLQQKYPLRVNLANTLMDILSIEKEATYRRLRGEVPFSFSEIAIISRKMGISIDNIIGADTPKSRPFHMKFTEHFEPTEKDYAILEEFVNILRNLKNDPNSEGGEATSVLPQPLYLMHEHVSKFHLFKWKYLYENKSKNIRFGDIVIPERLRKIQLENVMVAKYVASTSYILDNLLFTYLVNDINYFKSVYMINEDDAQQIKKELFIILNELEELTVSGHFIDTNNKIDIYISGVNFPTCYCYIASSNVRVTLLKAFVLNGVTSSDDKVFEELKGWMHSLKRQSILITQSAEKQRIAFFEKQRKIIESL